jgi:hypothetical protein
LGVPLWATLFFAAGVFASLAPNLLHLYGIHNDYEMAIYAGQRMSFFQESGHLMAIGRPIAALLSNIPVMPVRVFDDFRWTRLFSTLTVCLLGFQMIWICVRVLQVKVVDAVALALATFLTPAFIYSTLNATAWAPHLVTIFISLVAYVIVSRSNVQALAFLALPSWSDYRDVWRQMGAYLLVRRVLTASLVFQLALYDFPPNALIVAVFPVIAVLFSRAPQEFRTLLAVRDTAFIVGNLTLYVVTAKLIYMPLISPLGFALASEPASAFEARISQSYRYAFNTDVGEMLMRLREVATVSADLWFLPQARVHLVLGGAILLAFVSAAAIELVGQRRQGNDATTDSGALGRLSLRSWKANGVIAIVVSTACFLLAASAVLGSSGGFITYRTIPICMALAAIVAVYLARCGMETIWRFSRGVPHREAGAGDLAVILMMCAAVGGNFYMNYLTMRLARNEMAYFADIVRRADAGNKQAIVIIDPRPFSLPEDHPVAYDAKGRWVPPYELGCFSGPCLQTGAIARVVAQHLGYSDDRFKVYSLRGNDAAPALTCDGLASPTFTYLPGMPQSTVDLVKFLRSLRTECVNYNVDWLDLSRDAGG